MRAAPRSLVVMALAALGVSAVACVREGTAVVAAVEAADTTDAGPPAPLVIAPPPPAFERCKARLRALPIKTAAGCTLDERISKGNGVLLYPCSGEGAAEATFGEHRFEGTLGDGAMVLALQTELDWEDGCHWETHQTLRGTWRRDTKRPKLVWAYTEAPVQGTQCLGSCVASADVEVLDLDRRAE